MKKWWISYAATICLMGIFTALVLWFVRLDSQKTFSSPLPDFLTLAKNAQVSTINLFLPPFVHAQNSLIKKPAISGKSALVFDVTNEKVLFTKNQNMKLPMASLTKIMTAIVALEHKRQNNTYRVAKESLVGEDSMGLTEGEIVSLEDLLYGLVLVSGNDAAEVLAYNSYFGRKGFIQAMNDKAKSLGLFHTHFTNPTGLEGDGDQHTSVYDLMVITNYALSKFPVFREIASTLHYHIPYTDTHKDFYLDNETNLLGVYEGVRGVKTGYTPEAGLCLISYFEYKDHRIIAVLLGSNNRREDMQELLDFTKQVLE